MPPLNGTPRKVPYQTGDVHGRRTLRLTTVNYTGTSCIRFHNLSLGLVYLKTGFCSYKLSHRIVAIGTQWLNVMTPDNLARFHLVRSRPSLQLKCRWIHQASSKTCKSVHEMGSRELSFCKSQDKLWKADGGDRSSPCMHTTIITG